MSEVNIVNTDFKLNDIEELRGEQNYFGKIKRIEGTDKLLKKLRSFSTLDEALDFISHTPSKRNDQLYRFIPETEYLTRSDGGTITVEAMVLEIQGKRLDRVDISSLGEPVLEQIDSFLRDSLEIYENEGVCPGINLKNFILGNDQNLYYIDSEPYPTCNIEPFEMAHAREQKLTKIFGEDAQRKLPRTWCWIENHKVDNYRKTKSLAKRKRRDS